ncbi:MAG: hypothetical protein R2795_11385 [Saprospiraceae bacterium]
MDAIFSDPDQIKIKQGLNAETLDRMLQTTFQVVADHPMLISNRNGFKEVVSGVSQALSGYSFQRPDLFLNSFGSSWNTRGITWLLSVSILAINHPTRRSNSYCAPCHFCWKHYPNPWQQVAGNYI